MFASEQSAAVRSASRRDLLRMPGLGRFLRWRHNRTAVQILLFALAVMMVVDGLVGSPLAAKNTATIGAWVHYRGFIVLALLLAGNLFCAGCPFILPRKLARSIGRPTRRWPKALRNKWLALAGLVAILFLYELYDLWASPWLTAWVIVAYFATAFVLEAFFTRDSFCMYVCPLGTFNFLYSTISPLQITNRDRDVCRTCPGHECINGQWDEHDNLLQQGCQLELYVPTIQSNMNCTLCMDCVKACPYDNVALVTRPPGDELFRQNWPNRIDLALLAVVASAIGLVNAFAMTPPVYGLQVWLANQLQTRHEAIVLGIVFAVGALIVPLALVYGAAWLNRLTLGDAGQFSLNRQVQRFAYSFVPLGFGIWGAHYLFHLLIGPLTIIPAMQEFFANVLDVPLLGTPNWSIAGAWVLPLGVVQAIQMLFVGGGILGALAIAWSAAKRHASGSGRAWREVLPWAMILLIAAALAVYIFLQPMEMRGNVLG